MIISDYIPTRAMAIMAHPDDIEFSCAGTLIKWIQSGCKVSYVLCTSGDVGIATPGMTRERAAEIREAEASEAAAIAGVEEIIFLREPDGLLQPNLELRKRLVREIRRFRPEAVIAGDPTVVFSSDTYINHPDHRAAAIAALDAVFPAAGQPNLFQEFEFEGLQSHKVRKLFISGHQQNQVLVDITESMPLKLSALRAHVSQFVDWDPGDMVMEWAKEHAEGTNAQYGEVFRVITLETDENWERLRQAQNIGTH